ncbi:LysR family transcriptional regulator [Effusibacillus lacus]|uniref:LysR family transcriptional regulator n=1 Tax=Effusibacillus lacus TaxID=1348429 RepID=A0A292YIM5_9BACL|nr:LysR family transcriptional regulator [Effusibacillus lacus]TCS72506.1 LysR family transcriptional activator of glutamate synthase operon [Effusibacillus lacus]GAX90927.1 LysR family transcriptional regulator [Effusibacillus lacus]
MELRQIEYFIEVAKREHVTEAAHALHVAQSAVSRQIANLEEELGVQLFIREGRNVRLTQVGKIFMEHVITALKELDKAKQEIEEFLDPERGTIRIGFPSSLASYTLPSIISAFRNRHPHVGFQLRQGSYKYLIQGVSKGEFDLALVGPVPTNEKEVKGKILFQEKIVALLPWNHPLADQPSLRLSELQNDSFILFPEGFILRDLVNQACQQMNFKPNVSFEGEDIDAIKGLVAAGLGVTLLPEVTLNDNLPTGTVRLPIREPNITRTVGVIIPANRELPPSEKLFYDFLKEFFSVLNRFV